MSEIRPDSGQGDKAFIQTRPADVLWELVTRYLPHHTRALERCAAASGDGGERGALGDAYRSMPAASFSRDVLAHASARHV